MDDPPPPTARCQKTTTTAAVVAVAREPTSILVEETRGATPVKDNRTVMNFLRSLPPNIVANYIYPFAVKVIQNHEELIVAVDEYLDEYYSDDDGEAKNDDEDEFGSNRIRYPIGDWDVSRVEDFTSVLDQERNDKAKHFNEDLSRWNVTNGTSFARMFYGCILFHSDLSRWNVTKATNFCEMFRGCHRFNSDLSRWNVTNATNFSKMFFSCYDFNADLSRWNVANATNLLGMFVFCRDFNADLSRWNVANALDLRIMFFHCTIFNSDLSQWDVTNAIQQRALQSMFTRCDMFNRDFVAAWPLPDRQNGLYMF
jgi:surface protein